MHPGLKSERRILPACALPYTDTYTENPLKNAEICDKRALYKDFLGAAYGAAEVLT